MKLLAFDEGVNVSMGLPIIRTSVDHGTAFDIAGTGQARETSLLSAIDVALKMLAARQTAGCDDSVQQGELSAGSDNNRR